MKTEKRQYQDDALKALSKTRKKGNNTALLHMATGLGKTHVAIQDIVRSNPRRVLFTAHMVDVLDEAKDEAARMAPNMNIEFRTLQALTSDLEAYHPLDFDYIVYDEAHHIQAETYKKVADHFKPNFQLGLTATPERYDGKKISDVFGDPVFKLDLPHALAQGWLSQIDYHLLFDNAVNEAIQKGFNVSSLLKLQKLLSIKPRNEEIVATIAKEKKRLKLKHVPTIVFCSSISHAKEMAALLGGKAYHSNLGTVERDRIFNDFKQGRLEIICTVDTFNEGVNIPDARLLVFLRSTASKTVFFQQLGRGLRKTKKKRNVTVLDFAANIERLRYVKDLTEEVQAREILNPGSGAHPKMGLVFEGGSFTFSSEVIEILDRLEDLYQEPLEGEVLVKDLAKRYNYNTSHLVRLFREQGLPLKSVGGLRRQVADLKDWNTLVKKYPWIISGKKRGLSLAEISARHNLDRSVIGKHLKSLGVRHERILDRTGRYQRGYVVDDATYDRLLSTYSDMYGLPVADDDMTSVGALAKEMGVHHRKVNSIVKLFEDDLPKVRFKNGKIGFGINPDMKQQIIDTYKKTKRKKQLQRKLDIIRQGDSDD